MPRLEGTCNQCGLCCYVGDLHCEHLQVTGDLGTPLASACAVYAERVPGMPIVMVNAEGQPVTVMRCGHNDPMETQAIVERGIGRGCSLTLVED